jgi:alkanesulfonate monooxygenase SsuD/methylene tetrahydromethanopterin reductase-like flavin-dependent oxidoreductase (luciferase family)
MSNQDQPLAVVMMPLETRHEAILHLALTADELGYEAVFLPETWSYDITVLLAEIAVRTKQLRLGTGILSMWGRSAATLAMAASTLNMISEGRFILGLGSSTPQMAEGLHDTVYEAPYKKLRTMITQVRALIGGERIPLTGVSENRPLRLNLPAHADLPIYLAASAPRSIRIAGELCDGWIPFLFPRDHLADGVALLDQGANQAGTPGREWQVCPVIPTIVANDTAAARKGAAWVIAFYLTTMGPIYRKVLNRYGYQAEVAAILEANQGRKPAVVPPEAEVLLEQLTLYGTGEELREKLALWYASGATMPTLMTNPHLGMDEISFLLNALRPAAG